MFDRLVSAVPSWFPRPALSRAMAGPPRAGPGGVRGAPSAGDRGADAFCPPWVYPPVDPGLPAVPAAHVVVAQSALIATLREASGLDPVQFDGLALPAIEALARHVHLLPASDGHHFAAAGGLFRMCLELALHSRQAADTRLLATVATSEARRVLQPRWRFAALLAGLVAEVPVALSTLSVVDEDGHPWPPCLGSLEDWLHSNGAGRYHVVWVPPRGAGFEGGALLANLLPRRALAWLAEGSPDLVAALFAASAGRGSSGPDGLGEFVAAARQRVLSVAHATRPARYGQVRCGHHLEVHVLDAMRHLVACGRWSCGTPPLSLGPDGLFLDWPGAFDAIRSELVDQGLSGIPRTPFTVAALLAHAGALVPHSAGEWRWPRVSGGHALRFADPTAVLGYAQPAAQAEPVAQGASPAPASRPPGDRPPVGAIRPPLDPGEHRMVQAWQRCAEQAGDADLVWLPGGAVGVSRALVVSSGGDLASVVARFHRRGWLGRGDWPSPCAQIGPLPFAAGRSPGLVLTPSAAQQLGLTSPSG